MKRLVPTRHAALRYAERINPSLDVVSAWNFVTQEIRVSIPLPLRQARVRWARHGSSDKGRKTPLPKFVSQYRFTPRALLIVAGSQVVTVFEVSTEDLATVLVWCLFRDWVDDEV